MEITIKDRKGKELGKLKMEAESTVWELKKSFYKLQPRYEPNRQWFTIEEVRGTPLKDNYQTLKSYGIKGNTTLYFKDLGLQIAWKLVFFIEYFGPIAIFALFYLFPQIYGAAGAK